jgi:uncharacterized Zn-binding protein involved in type VI secretion
MKPVAKQGDCIVAVDVHLVIAEGGGKPEPMSLPFNGVLVERLSVDVLSENFAVATVGSLAKQSPGHVVSPKTFAKPPSNKGLVVVGSATVLVNNQAIARHGDTAETCNDPADAPVGSVVAVGTVLAG